MSLRGGLARVLSRRGQLFSGTLGEPLHADRCAHLERTSQLHARVDGALFGAQPLAVEEMCSRQLDRELRTLKMIDGAPIEILGDLALIEQCRTAGFHAESPICPGGTCDSCEPFERIPGELG